MHHAGLKHAAGGLLKIQDTKMAKNAAFGYHHTLCRAVSLQLRHVLTIGKKLVKPSPTCLYNMVNFGSLTAEIGLPVWGTPANFIGFRILGVHVR